MSQNSKKTYKSVSKIWTYSLLAFFVILIVFSIIITVISHPNIIKDTDAKTIDFFSTQISNSYELNAPFSIFIDLISTIAGVFFGIRIDQIIKEKEEKENIKDTWELVNKYLTKMKSGIENKSIIELFEYRIYWEAIQQTDISTLKLIQKDEKYLDLYYVFSFLTFYKNFWEKYDSIEQFKANSSNEIIEQINNWEKKLDFLIVYTNMKL